MEIKIDEITEGKTRILVPFDSIRNKVPPREPAFFNPKAKMNRDFSIIAYSAFLEKFDGPKIFLEGLAGIGARGIRVANEIPNMDKIIINDLNPIALNLATKSASLNNLKNFETSEEEVCRFLSKFTKKGNRGTIVDIDPFGSPSKFIDCGIRATMHGGLFSCTATDLQVLNGLFNNACKRRYGGIPLKTHYSKEIALRLVIGCIRTVASRMDIEIIPLFVESEMHYYRIYLKILNRADQEENLGYIHHCYNCGNRGISINDKIKCDVCNKEQSFAGPLWIDNIFDKKFIEEMLEQIKNHTIDKNCEKILQKCLVESELPGTYFTLDEIASRMNTSPLSLQNAIKKLKDSGFDASQTSFDPTGFRTTAKIDKIMQVFSD